MADSGGQKPVRNSLLSAAATTSNFFEDEAMFVPVTLVEPEPVEPATSEIDLNSDESSSNRGSVEKEIDAPVLPVETEDEPPSPVEETAPPISLFSRASTGVDAFTRMLTGGSASKPAVTSAISDGKDVAVLRAAVMEDTKSVAEMEPSFSASPMLPSSPPTATPPMKQGITSSFDDNIASSSSLFSASTTALLDLSGSFPSASSTSTTYMHLPPPSVAAIGSTVQVPSPNSSAADNHAAAVPSAAPSIPLFPPQPSDPFNLTTGISSSIASNPANIPSASSTTGSGNAFRLGSQKKKYVPCREIASVPSLTQPPVSIPSPAMPQPLAPPFLPSVPSHNPSNSGNGLFPAPTPLPPVQFDPSLSMIGAAPSSSSSYFGTPVASMTNNSNGMSSSGPPMTTPPQMTNSPYFNNHPEAHQFLPQTLMPLTYHWYFRKDVDGKTTWKPFSIIDSVALEDAFTNDPERLVPTDGGRYDVDVQRRVKLSVYWDEVPIEVRRGSWFYKGPLDKRFVPYDEDFALNLEREYSESMRTGVWQKRLEFPDGESVILHNAGMVVHFCQAAAPDDWGNLPESQLRPRVVKRGCDEMEVEDGESAQVDHLVFVVHGIGPICDFKLRNIVEAVDDFRGLSFQLLNGHYKESIDKNLVGRVEFLPVSWHKALHGDRGIDEQLKRITLRSIPKFRDFTNNTLLDILFYTSPMFCQTIITSVSSELNRLHKLFLTRNPNFKGQVSLTGHSLGSLILFDLLAHQPGGDSCAKEAELTVDGQEPLVTAQDVQTQELTPGGASRTVSYTIGNAGTGQPYINYPPLDFSPSAFFALGSPIAMFVTIRGIEKLGNDFRLPNCQAFFNIFHPYDPVAYRIETLIDPDFEARPVLIPHHKGRKRIHLELKDTMARVGADIKQKLVDAVKTTWNTVYQYTGLNARSQEETLETEIQNAIAGEIEKRSEVDGGEDDNSNIHIGSLNGGRRIDHVLQEAPYETFNEYVFAMSTHVGYWESEDTMLLILTEIYESMGIQKDRQVNIAQNVGSPMPGPFALPPSANQGFSNVYNAIAPQAPPQYQHQYQPSAPPSTDFLSPSKMHYSASSPSLASATFTPSLVSPQSTSIPLIPQVNPGGETYFPPNLGAGGLQGTSSRPSLLGSQSSVNLISLQSSSSSLIPPINQGNDISTSFSPNPGTSTLQGALSHPAVISNQSIMSPMSSQSSLNSFIPPNNRGNDMGPATSPNPGAATVQGPGSYPAVIGNQPILSPVPPPSVPSPLIPPINSGTEVGSYFPPPPGASGVQSPGTRPAVIGNRPVVDPSMYPRGMDPTAPMITMTQVGPPPKAGFVRKQ
ncbi:unnamed protein product [Orchesella dallaii]|uniref:SEC23-interacting protein n=1 Tax=Orchesella dallaii TaxID=48710 RepID=A0ABP1PNA9_9HEXA